MQLGRYHKGPADRKRYVVDYDNWLDAGEQINNAEVSTPLNAEAFTVDGMMVDEDGSREIVFFVSGGVDGGEYNVYVTIYTTSQQIKQDFVTFVVNDEGSN